MKSKFKRMLAVLTAVLMLLCMLPAGIFAEGEDIPIDEAHFPDENFRNFVKTGYGLSANYNGIKIDANSDGSLSPAEIAAVNVSIDVYNKDISNLKGIEYFTALKSLNCNDNQLTSLDVSCITGLRVLECEENQLTQLDVSKNTALTILKCGYNQLTALDVSKNTALDNLDCSWNKLTELDVSNNTALTWLQCYDNQLAALDVSMLSDLGQLDCSSNSLTELNVSSNLELWNFFCDDNPLGELDVTLNTKLKDLGCSNTQLTNLNVSKNTALTALYCDNNSLTSLDISKNKDLVLLYCEHNQLTALDVSIHSSLDVLWCSGNQLTQLDVSNNTQLTELNCGDCVFGGNQLTALDVSMLTKLKEFYCVGNELTELDVSHNTALTTLDCSENQLTSLNLSNNTNLPTTWNGDDEWATGFRCENNWYRVPTNPFNLTELPGNFNIEKASEFTGGTVNNTVLTFEGSEATYKYNCEGGRTAVFKLLAPDGITPAPPAPEGMGTITVVNPRANKTYNAYCVFDLTYSPADAPVNYAYSIQGNSPWFTIVNNYASSHDHGLKLIPTAANPNHYIVEFASAENPIEGYGTFDPVEFALYLKDNVPEGAEVVAKRDSGSTPTGPIRLTTDGNAPVWTPEQNNVWVPLGYYFVTTSIGTFCSLDSADPDAYIYDKNEVPGWDGFGKVVAAENPYVDENPGSWGRTSDETIGSEAWFKIMASVPAYEYGHQVEQYTFTDTLGEGFTYDANSLKITLYTGLNADTGEPIADPSTVLYDSTHTDVHGVTVTFNGNTITVKLQLTGDDAIDLDGADGEENYYPDAHIEIEYKTHVDKDAVHDNVNTAKMDWSWDESNPVPNPPSAPEQPAVPEDAHTNTHVYGLPFNKTIKDSNPVEYLPGAEFELYSDAACEHIINLVADDTLPTGAPEQAPEGSVQWTYYRVADATETTADNFESETIEAGRAVIWGLAPGTYYLKETKAPDGYNPLAEPFPITICTENDPNTQDVNEVNVDEHGYVIATTFNVENAAGAELPGVGGIGTTIFYIVGALLMIAAAVLLTVRKKMSAQE